MLSPVLFCVCVCVGKRGHSDKRKSCISWPTLSSSRLCFSFCCVFHFSILQSARISCHTQTTRICVRPVGQAHAHTHSGTHHLKCCSSVFGRHLHASTAADADNLHSNCGFFFLLASSFIGHCHSHNDWPCYRLSVALFWIPASFRFATISIYPTCAYVLLPSKKKNEKVKEKKMPFRLALSFSIKANCVACFCLGYPFHFSFPPSMCVRECECVCACVLHKSFAVKRFRCLGFV